MPFSFRRLLQFEPNPVVYLFMTSTFGLEVDKCGVDDDSVFEDILL